MEIFKPITGYEEFYSVSNTGSVRSERNGKILRPATDRYGYHYYVLCVSGNRRTVKAHRLVATEFIPNPDKKPTVDHINGNKTDNRVENLKWATAKEQSNNPVTYEKLSTRDSNEQLRKMGQKKNFGRKAVVVSRDGVTVGYFSSLKSAAESMGVNYPKASECANGKRERIGAYKFSWGA